MANAAKLKKDIAQLEKTIANPKTSETTKGHLRNSLTKAKAQLADLEAKGGAKKAKPAAAKPSVAAKYVAPKKEAKAAKKPAAKKAAPAKKHTGAADKVRKDIEQLKKSIANPKTSETTKTHLRASLAKAELHLADLTDEHKSTGKKVAHPKPTGKSLLGKNKDLLAKYKDSGIDIPRDANRRAKPFGKRRSKNGKTYYEYRANRADVNPKNYPRLEKGGTLEMNDKKVIASAKEYKTGDGKKVMGYVSSWNKSTGGNDVAYAVEHSRVDDNDFYTVVFGVVKDGIILHPKEAFDDFFDTNDEALLVANELASYEHFGKGEKFAAGGEVMGVDRKTSVEKVGNHWIFTITWADLIDGKKVWRSYPNHVSEHFDTKHEAEEGLAKELVFQDKLQKMSKEDKFASGGEVMGVDRKTSVEKVGNHWIFTITWADLIDGKKVWRSYPNHVSEHFDTKAKAEEGLTKELVFQDKLQKLSKEEKFAAGGGISGLLYTSDTDPLAYLKHMGAKVNSDLNHTTKSGIDFYVGYKGDKALVVAFRQDSPIDTIGKEGMREMSETAKTKGVSSVELYTNYAMELHSRNEKPSSVGFDKIYRVADTAFAKGGEVYFDEDKGLKVVVLFKSDKPLMETSYGADHFDLTDIESKDNWYTAILKSEWTGFDYEGEELTDAIVNELNQEEWGSDISDVSIESNYYNKNTDDTQDSQYDEDVSDEELTDHMVNQNGWSEEDAAAAIAENKDALVQGYLADKEYLSDDNAAVELLPESEELPAEPEVPPHFGSGENIEVFGYMTKNFDICGLAVKEFTRVINEISLEDDGLMKTKMKESCRYAAMFCDSIFGNEKEAVQDGFVLKTTFERVVEDLKMLSIHAYLTTKRLNTTFIDNHFYEIGLRIHPESIPGNMDPLAQELSGGKRYAAGGDLAGKYTVVYNFNHGTHGFQNSVTIPAKDKEQALAQAKKEVSEVYGSGMLKKFSFKEPVEARLMRYAAGGGVVDIDAKLDSIANKSICIRKKMGYHTDPMILTDVSVLEKKKDAVRVSGYTNGADGGSFFMMGWIPKKEIIEILDEGSYGTIVINGKWKGAFEPVEDNDNEFSTGGKTTTVYTSGLSKKDEQEIREEWRDSGISITDDDAVEKWCKMMSGEFSIPSGVIKDIISTIEYAGGGATKKPIYMVVFVQKSEYGTTGAQALKAVDEEEAKRKFFKMYPKKTEDDIIDCSLLEKDHKHYNHLSSYAK